MRLENYPQCATQCATQLDSQNHMKRAIDKLWMSSKELLNKQNFSVYEKTIQMTEPEIDDYEPRNNVKSFLS